MLLLQAPPVPVTQALAPAAVRPASAGAVTGYPASYFDAAQPYSALDMVQRLPGFSLKEPNQDVRGFGGAGNVLVDGERPTSKQDTLSDMLKRIPARSVDRIELIRNGAQGVDLRGETLVANVVRRRSAASSGEAEAALLAYRGGLVAPTLRLQGQRQWGGRSLEGSAYLYREIADNKGDGSRRRSDLAGASLRHAAFSEHEAEGGYQFKAAYRQPLAGGALGLTAGVDRKRGQADIVDRRISPQTLLTLTVEHADEDATELGATWDRDLAGGKISLVGLDRRGDRFEDERAVSEGAVESVSYSARFAESIVRASIQRALSDRWQVETGVEGAFNVLDGHVALIEDNAPIDLPAANVRVAETRGEAFASLTWQTTPTLSLLAGVRQEASRLRQTGDTALTKSLAYFKPRLVATWTPRPGQQLRLRLEREVGQLDFADFTSSASISQGAVTAGNKNLAPDRRWAFQVDYERRVLQDGALVLTYLHEDISDLVDRLAFVDVDGAVFDTRGNIGDGRKDETKLGFTLPLQRFGIAGGLLKGELGYRWTSVIDPTTGAPRDITDEAARFGEIHFTQDLTAQRIRWGVDVIPATDTPEFRFNEIRHTRSQLQINTFGEKAMGGAWRLRLDVKNLTDRKAFLVRDVYDGSRAATPLAFREVRRLSIGPFVGLILRRSY